MKRGQPIFLIWYANIDCETRFKKNDPVQLGIDADRVTGIAGELQSFASLASKIKDVDKSLDKRIQSVEREQSYYRSIGALALAAVVALTVNWLKDNTSSKPPILAPPTATHTSIIESD